MYRGFAGLEESQLDDPGRVPPRFVPPEVPDLLPDDPVDPDPHGDPDEAWDPVGLNMLARWLARAYLRAQADPDQDV